MEAEVLGNCVRAWRGMQIPKCKPSHITRVEQSSPGTHWVNNRSAWLGEFILQCTGNTSRNPTVPDPSMSSSAVFKPAMTQQNEDAKIHCPDARESLLGPRLKLFSVILSQKKLSDIHEEITPKFIHEMLYGSVCSVGTDSTPEDMLEGNTGIQIQRHTHRGMCTLSGLVLRHWVQRTALKNPI